MKKPKGIRFKKLKMVLGRMGFDYCETCGKRGVFDTDRFIKGYGARTDCPHCDHLDRFDIRPATREAKKRMDKVHREKGRPPYANKNS